MKRILFVVVAALAVAAFTTSAASAEESAPTTVFCLNGSTVMVGDDLSPYLTWLPGVEPQEFILTEETAVIFRDRIEANGGSWTFRVVDEDGPLTGPNVVTAGPCDGPTVSTDRSFWLCYSQTQTDPAVYSRATAMSLYEDGYTVPYAVREPLSKTNIGNGVYLTCRMPTGYSVVAGTAVSTGGGEMYTQPAGLVAYMLGEMPLDYTRLIAKG